MQSRAMTRLRGAVGFLFIFKSPRVHLFSLEVLWMVLGDRVSGDGAFIKLIISLVESLNHVYIKSVSRLLKNSPYDVTLQKKVPLALTVTSP